MYKIGLFGGSFDPIHNGHLQIAITAKDQLSLAKIIFIPAAIPPHKQHIVLTLAHFRLRLVQIAVENYPDFEVSDFEIVRGNISYSIDTLHYFCSQYHLSREHLFFIIGSDSLLNFHSWRAPEEILQLCQLVVYNRSGVNLELVDDNLKKQAIFLDAPFIDISSTTIRQKIREGKSLNKTMPRQVVEYIFEHHLYR